MTDLTTLRLFARLPGYVREADEAQGSRPLLNYLSLPGRQLDAVATLAARLDRRAADPRAVIPSDLADPEAADDARLDWQAQPLGVTLRNLVGPQARRDAVRYAPAGRRKATRDAIAGAARSALTGTRYVGIYDHSVSSPGDGTVWDLLIITRGSETPVPAAVLQAIVDKRAKPTGAVLHHRTYSTSWGQVEAARPTWGDIDGHTWQQLEESGL